MKISEELKLKLSYIPKLPGCYLWKNKYNEVIYVGKAKNLFARVHQYFDKSISYKTILLVNEIHDIDYIIVNNVNESLVLENNLIKKYYPKYNILLKDSSEYPYIVITDEIHPRIIYTHHYGSYKGKYYGPLADSSFNRYDVYKLLNEIAPFKKSGPLKNQNSLFMDFNKFDSNTDFKIVYQKWRKWIDDLFNGKATQLVELMNQKEQEAVYLLDFEQAKKYHELSESLIKLSTSQIVQLNKNTYSDFIAYFSKDNYIAINIFSYIDGKLLSKHSQIYDFYHDDHYEVIANFVMQYYSVNKVPNKIIIILDENNLDALSKILNTEVCLPKTKTETKIMETSFKNANDYLKTKILEQKTKLIKNKNNLESLAKLLNIDSVNHIEIFDNSNLGYADPVSGMAVYINGKPNKKLYRRFNLNQLDKYGDYNYMKEVIFRRYSRLKQQNSILFPNLIIVDGGQIQVNAALCSLKELELDQKINVIGLKKDNYHKTDTIVLANGNQIKLDKKSDVYLFLLNMQEEVHNYVISYFRKKHTNNFINNFYKDIKGLGKKRLTKLLDNYPTIEDIKNANPAELEQILPKNIVNQLLNKINQ